MSDHVLSILVKALGAASASKSLNSVDKALGNIGKKGKGVSGTGKALATVGGAAAGAGVTALFFAVKSGINDLAELETATTSVDGAIKQMGQTGKVSATQVAAWSNEIEASVGAAFDDKAITAATANLIRYGKVTPKNLRPAMVVMTDLAARTGSVDSASKLLAKALADPAKAAGALRKAGVVLTDQQQKQIKAMVKAGKTAEAQQYILDQLAKSTKGAAAASQGPYQRALSQLADASEDARKALAIGFLPVIERVAKWLSTELAKPEVIANITTFGQKLADGFSSALDFAQKIPWDAIGNGMKTAAGWAKALFDAFRSLPPEVQGTIVALAGLNKLSGGAVSGIIGELGKGLIKGVLGMTAGVVNLKAGVVNGGGAGGAGGGAAGAAGAAGKGASLASKALSGVAIVTSLAAVLETWQSQNSASTEQAHGVQDTQKVYLTQSPTTSDLTKSLAGVDQGIKDIQSNPLLTLVQGDALTTLQNMRTELNARIAENRDKLGEVNTSTRDTSKNVKDASMSATSAASRGRDAIESAKVAGVSAAGRTTEAAKSAGFKAKEGGMAAARAIDRKDLSVTVKTTLVAKTYVTAAGIRSVIAQSKRIAKSNGSYGGDSTSRGGKQVFT